MTRRHHTVQSLPAAGGASIWACGPTPRALARSRPSPRAAADQLTLEFSQAAEHRQHQAAVRGGGFSPSTPERPEANSKVQEV